MTPGEPRGGDIATHFKGGSYVVVGVACNSETLEKVVVYRPVYDPDKLWARPLDNFMGEVKPGVPRFTLS